MGSWRNISSNKYAFKVKWDNEGYIKTTTEVEAGNDKDAVTLKREYFSLKHDIHNDVRKRIDTIIGK